jgi:hypothetical protein
VNPTTTPAVILWRPQGRDLLLGVATEKGDGTMHSWLRREDRERDHHELIRLLYVAATRARFSLHLFATLEHVDSIPVAPPEESLLAQIWPIAAKPVDVVPTAAPVMPVQTRTRCVLPDDYTWSPPFDYREVVVVGSATAPGSTRTDGGGHFERAIGTVVHRALAALTIGPLPVTPDLYVTTTRGSWRNQLANLGIHGTGLAAATEEVARQMKLVLADDAGRWILESRGHSASEAELTGFDGDDLIHVTPDRTFLDSSGDRWIIDYKSSRMDAGQSQPDFIATQRERHVAQLRRYKRLLARLGPEPVRIAIYLTALPAFVELDTDLDFFPNGAENRPL